MFSGSASAVSSSGSRPWSLIARSPVGSAGGGHTSHSEKFGPPSFLSPCVGATALGHSLVNFHVEAGKWILSFCQTSPHCAARGNVSCHRDVCGVSIRECCRSFSGDLWGSVKVVVCCRAVCRVSSAQSMSGLNDSVLLKAVRYVTEYNPSLLIWKSNQ